MKKVRFRTAALAGFGPALCLGTAAAWAGRTTSARNAGFEFTRIVSQFNGGSSETIAPWETVPTLPIRGETLIYGTSNLFPEFARVFVFDGVRWTELAPGHFTFHADLISAGEGTPPSQSTYSVVFRFSPAQVQRIQNRYVLFQIFPIPPGPHGDTVEALSLRSP